MGLFSLFSGLLMPSIFKAVHRYVAVCLGTIFFSTAVLAQSSAGGETLRAEVQKHLQSAQDALKAGQAEQALTMAKQALTPAQLTGFELTWIHRVLGAAAFTAKDVDQAAQSFTYLVTQSGLTASEKRPYLERLIGLSQQKKDHPRVVQWSRQYLTEGGANPMVRSVLVQTLSHLNAHEDLVREVQVQLQLDAAEKRKPNEAFLRLMAVSQRELKRIPDYEATLWRLLENYPSQEYWREIIERQAQKDNVNPRLELDFYRLLEETDNLKGADEYVEMAQLAIKSGMPAEALRVLNTGFEKAVFAQGPDGAEQGKLKAQAQLQAEKDSKALEPLEKLAKSGNEFAALADAYLSKRQWARAVVFYDKALSMGGLRRPAEVQLHSGMALIKSGDSEKAQKVLAQIHDDPTALVLAKLWRLRGLAL
jgi:tetratricopeptide (TPR) repeat protein